MLPFMKPKRQAGISISYRKPDGSTEMKHEEGDELNEMEICAEDILRAITNKDAKALASAIQAAIECSASTSEPIDSQGDSE